MKTQTKSAGDLSLQTPKIKIGVKRALSGVKFELKVSPNEVVENMKKMVAAKLPGLYGLKYGCSEMKDEEALSAYSVVFKLRERSRHHSIRR
jgi:hypothetical protein